MISGWVSGDYGKGSRATMLYTMILFSTTVYRNHLASVGGRIVKETHFALEAKFPRKFLYCYGIASSGTNDSGFN